MRALTFVAVVTVAFSAEARDRRTHTRPPVLPAPDATVVGDQLATTQDPPSEALTGFDGVSNGLVDAATHAADLEAFDGAEEIDEGLGPVYNAQACRECHQSPISGAASQITELRVGHLDRRGLFVNPEIPIGNGSVVVRGRSLIADRTICPNAIHPNQNAQQRVPVSETIRALRISLSTLGDGYVEAIPSSALERIASDQCRSTRGAVCGEILAVPVLEAGNRMRVGRFGWKGQHASLISFSADAYLNEMGITSDLQPEDVTSLCDTVDDPEDEVDASGMSDVDRFARFMRATKAPPRDAALAALPETQRGEALFAEVGCALCHVPTHLTAPAGSVVNAGAFVVPEALGNKLIHPYSDFLLHDVGTGDGIVQNGPQSTARKLRTPPLWGLRTKSRFMHDAKPTSIEEAVLRHAGEASGASRAFQLLPPADQQRIVQFLQSL